MPYPNEHSARIREPGEFQADSFRRKNLPKAQGKKSPVSIILGKLTGESSMTVQAYRFPVDSYSVQDAKDWLKTNKISYIKFEPAKEGGKMLQYSQPIKISELKSVGDEWSVEGYPSTFGNIDLGQDMVMPGAFKETLSDGPRVRFLFAHDPRLVLGVPKDLKEDKTGLFGDFKISRTQLGSDTHTLLKDGAIDSFSIGYEAKDFEFAEIDGVQVRKLNRIKLYEVSLVPIPMNQEAIVTGVKAYLSLADQMNEAGMIITSVLNDLRGVVADDRPLSETKRQELTALLETFSGMDAVRASLQTVITSASKSTRLVSPRMLSHQLADARKRLSHILQE